MKILSIIAVAFLASGVSFPSDFQTEKSFISVNGRCALPSFQKAFQDSDAVFLGKVISNNEKGDYKTYNFQVERYWKGKVLKKMEIIVYDTPRFQSSFEKSEKYLIYAIDDGKGNLMVERCSLSRKIEDATEDLRKLGKGKRPRK